MTLRKKSLFGIALWLGLGASALAQEVSPVPSPSGPAKGDLIPAFDAPGLAGSNVHVDFPKGSKTVLIFFLSSCPHCQRMIPKWNSLFERKPADLKVLGVVMDDPPPGFFEALHVAFPVIHSPGRAYLHDIKVITVPVTVRVGEGGKVLDSIVGETDALRVGELFAP
jgi:thiol-disulfide isomerase/thioredoxin